LEAHGTGTSLGDPVEANALARTFKRFTDRKNYCAVGSAKSHIGHLGACSGVAGLIKLLLSLKHRRLPPLMHFKQLNPLIEFDDSAFYVNTEAMDWRPAEGKPLMAGLNSFGHSGTNVHLVVREFVSAPSPRSDTVVLIPLSARDEERLRVAARNLRDVVTEEASLNLTDLAYTLQVGREAMEARVIFRAESLAELREKLSEYLEGIDRVAGCYQGHVDTDTSRIRLLDADEDTREMIEKWIAKGKLEKVAELWSQGIELDWTLFHGAARPRRIHLPTYPFAREVYWRPEKQASSYTALLHPLVHLNTSDFEEQRFSSSFSGNEPFLADHQVQGRNILPGVAYLEMARKAVELTVGPGQDIQLKHIAWVRPFEAGELHIGLAPEADGSIQFEIYTGMDRAVLSQGRAVLDAPALRPPAHDLEALREACQRNHLDAGACYAFLEQAGLIYGPSHRGLKEIYVGEDCLLAELALPKDTGG
ncbi:MAG: ketoacyl-synthetase C-terminal extension domain-containing protein, partial [Verrucomicrobiota bacterium]